jgi:hypothetical protein
MLKGKDWKLLWNVPEFTLFKEDGRSLRLDEEAERKLFPVAEQPLHDIVVLMRDTGMRNVAVCTQANNTVNPVEPRFSPTPFTIVRQQARGRPTSNTRSNT